MNNRCSQRKSLRNYQEEGTWKKLEKLIKINYAMQTIKLVTFDATNTLLKFKIPPWQYYYIVAQDYGFTGTERILKSQMKESFKKMDEKHPNFGKNDITWECWWKEVVKLTFHDQLPTGANIENIANKLIHEFKTAKCWTVADGTQDLLRHLKKTGVCVGIISNFDPRLIDILQNTSLYDKLDFILTSYDVGYSKPDERIFNSAIRTCKMSVKPSECLHVGDDFEKDYNGARGAGWHALLIGSTTNSKVPHVANHIFNSVQELYNALIQNRIQL